jgi:hypothetical protein
VYNKSFEDSRLKTLARKYPEHAAPLELIRGRLVDLATPFQQMHVYRTAMRGSYSLKRVLPAMVPGFSRAYEDLAVGGGRGGQWAVLAVALGGRAGAGGCAAERERREWEQWEQWECAAAPGGVLNAGHAGHGEDPGAALPPRLPAAKKARQSTCVMCFVGAYLLYLSQLN